ncbi:MAG TPA: NAD(P)-binding domain-containing protein, partial [Polyangiaceae bacterium]|nr:NAD(P)-binding domain-containing protein [Polyangiaceae bacterium]
MTDHDLCQFGVAGLGVMGAALALNVSDHGFRVAVWNQSHQRTSRLLQSHPQNPLVGSETLEQFVASLQRPRSILLMIKAGEPVDEMLDRLQPLLSPGDIVIDGGNSWYKDTQRREQRMRAAGMEFVGCGVSGGEKGARLGPSIMPGGSASAWARLRPVLESIAARSDSGSCVAHVGPDGAGHFVKMVHNGIEYGDMQILAEAYDLMRKVGGLDAPTISAVFERWNAGVLESFLVELAA